MSERKFNTYMKRHLLKENVGGDVENEFQNWLDEMSLKFDDEKITLQTVIDYAQDTLQDYGMDDWQPGQPLPENKKSLNEEVTFEVFMNNLRNYSSDTDRDEMLTMLTDFIMDMGHEDHVFVNIINQMADRFDRDGDGNHLTENKKSVKENIETLLSPEDLKYYRAHRDEIEDILHAEWRHSKLSAKDAVEKHKENKLQQAKRGGGKETSLRAIAALGSKNK